MIHSADCVTTQSKWEGCVTNLGSDEFRWFIVLKEEVNFSKGKLRCPDPAMNKRRILICPISFLPVLPWWHGVTQQQDDNEGGSNSTIFVLYSHSPYAFPLIFISSDDKRRLVIRNPSSFQSCRIHFHSSMVNPVFSVLKMREEIADERELLTIKIVDIPENASKTE